jgi:hypothetical protein
MLFHIRGDIDIKATLVSNITPANPSKGMQVLLNQPCAACASKFADLMQMTLELARQKDFTSIRLTQILIRVMSKILASHMLQGNFMTKKVTSLKLEANSVEPLAFLPQRNKVLVKRELSSEVKATSEKVMDFADSHKTKGKTRRPRLLALVLCNPWWTSPVFASTWIQSSPPFVPMTGLSQSSVKFFLILLP